MSDLFYDNLYLVNLAIKKFPFSEKDDLYQSGCMGLHLASKRYKEELGYSFSTFAMPYIVNEMRKEIRATSLVRLNRDVYKVLNYIKTDSYYSINEISEKLNVNRKNVITALFYRSIQCFDESIFLSSESDIYKYILDLNDLEKNVILLSFHHNLYQYDISNILNISQQTVSRIRKKAIEKIKLKFITF